MRRKNELTAPTKIKDISIGFDPAHGKKKKYNEGEVVFMSGRKYGEDLFSNILEQQQELFEWQRHMLNHYRPEGIMYHHHGRWRSMKPPKKEVIQESFPLTEHLSLKLVNDKTEVYIIGKRFMVCKYLILNIPVNKTHKYDDIQSIDHLIERTGEEHQHTKVHTLPSPKARFWGHCSNFQVWVENNYDTRLIDSRLAFPILKRLKYLGDKKAGRIYKKEIVDRILDGYNNAFQRVKSMGGFDDFTIEELQTLYEDLETRHFNNKVKTLESCQNLINNRKKFAHMERQRKKEIEREKKRLERLERMWKKQEANVRANERKKQQSLLFWVYETPESAVPFFARAYREKRWLEQMLYRHTVSNIAKRASVSNTTIYYWIKKHKISVSNIRSEIRMIRNKSKKIRVGG
jgi:hypothetical protein